MSGEIGRIPPKKEGFQQNSYNPDREKKKKKKNMPVPEELLNAQNEIRDVYIPKENPEVKGYTGDPKLRNLLINQINKPKSKS